MPLNTVQALQVQTQLFVQDQLQLLLSPPNHTSVVGPDVVVTVLHQIVWWDHPTSTTSTSNDSSTPKNNNTRQLRSASQPSPRIMATTTTMSNAPPTTVYPLQVMFQVTARLSPEILLAMNAATTSTSVVSSNSSSSSSILDATTTFNEWLQDTITLHATTYLTDLHNHITPPINQIFMMPVTSVQALSVSQVLAPTVAPSTLYPAWQTLSNDTTTTNTTNASSLSTTPANSNSTATATTHPKSPMSGGAIAGLVVGLLVVLSIGGTAYWRQGKLDQAERERLEQEKKELKKQQKKERQQQQQQQQQQYSKESNGSSKKETNVENDRGDGHEATRSKAKQRSSSSASKTRPTSNHSTSAPVTKLDPIAEVPASANTNGASSHTARSIPEPPEPRSQSAPKTTTPKTAATTPSTTPTSPLPNTLEPSSTAPEKTALTSSQTTNNILKTLFPSRTVQAPPGKLGILIDTTSDGPVVHTVHPGSAMERLLVPGDLILSINGIATHAMSADELTKVMTQNIHRERKLVVVSSSSSSAAGGPIASATVGLSATKTESRTKENHAPVEGSNTTALSSDAGPGLAGANVHNQPPSGTLPAPEPEPALSPSPLSKATTQNDSFGKPKPASKRPTRTVMAPPGKLGIVIDTTADGPLVHTVHPGSPLEQLLFPGDLILSIDGADTRTTTAIDLTQLMARTANQQRKLTVVAKDLAK